MIPRPATHSKALGPGVTGPELLQAQAAVVERPPAQETIHPSCGAKEFGLDPEVAGSSLNPRQHTKYPYVTGTSVIALKYNDGVLIAADTLG